MPILEYHDPSGGQRSPTLMVASWADFLSRNDSYRGREFFVYRPANPSTPKQLIMLEPDGYYVTVVPLATIHDGDFPELSTLPEHMLPRDDTYEATRRDVAMLRRLIPGIRFATIRGEDPQVRYVVAQAPNGLQACVGQIGTETETLPRLPWHRLSRDVEPRGAEHLLELYNHGRIRPQFDDTFVVIWADAAAGLIPNPEQTAVARGFADLVRQFPYLAVHHLAQTLTLATGDGIPRLMFRGEVLGWIAEGRVQGLPDYEPPAHDDRATPLRPPLGPPPGAVLRWLPGVLDAAPATSTLARDWEEALTLSPLPVLVRDWEEALTLAPLAALAELVPDVQFWLESDISNRTLVTDYHGLIIRNNRTLVASCDGLVVRLAEVLSGELAPDPPSFHWIMQSRSLTQRLVSLTELIVRVTERRVTSSDHQDVIFAAAFRANQLQTLQLQFPIEDRPAADQPENQATLTWLAGDPCEPTVLNTANDRVWVAPLFRHPNLRDLVRNIPYGDRLFFVDRNTSPLLLSLGYLDAANCFRYHLLGRLSDDIPNLPDYDAVRQRLYRRVSTQLWSGAAIFACPQLGVPHSDPVEPRTRQILLD